MQTQVHQGDILKVERVSLPVLVTSKDFFNLSGEIIGCPVYAQGTEGPLHIPVKGSRMAGLVHCEKLALLDLQQRGYTITDHLPLDEMINITDAIQGIFDYI